MNAGRLLIDSRAKSTVTRTRRRGFALVATLTLMMLLGLIAVGILAMAASQNRIAAQTILRTEARQHALIGLDAALSALQMEVGPDQRVTASSGILSEDPANPQHILGVWNSWQAPLYSSSKGMTISSTYTQGRASMFRRWLISCKNASTSSQLESISDLGSSKPGQRICMVGEGTLGAKADGHEYVYADLIEMPSTGRNEPCFAWWVGGENQKANVAVKDREPSEDPVEILRRTWDTPAPDFSSDPDLAFIPEKIEEPEKLLTLRTLSLVDRGSAPAGTPYFFDVTTFSYSLITNVRDGGLKLDLNLLLNKKSLEGTGLEERSKQDCPLAEGDGLPTGTEPNFPIGSWQTMHAFYNMWPDGTGQDKDFSSPRLIGDVTNAYTRMGGSLKEATRSNGDKVSYFTDRANNEDQGPVYARTPVLISLLGSWGLYSEPVGNGYRPSFAYSPVAIWWNPYNVQMRVGPKKLWVYAWPYRTCAFIDFYHWEWESTPNSGGTVTSPQNEWRYHVQFHPVRLSDRETYLGKNPFNMMEAMGLDWGNYFVNSENDNHSDIVFEPGEILAFTMVNPTKTTSDNFGEPYKRPFVLGDQPNLRPHIMAVARQNSMSPEQLEKFPGRLALELRSESFLRKVRKDVERTFNKQNYFMRWIRTMGEVLDYDVHYDVHYSPPVDVLFDDKESKPTRSSFVIMHGFGGLGGESSAPAKVVKGDDEWIGRAYVDHFYDARGISPYIFNIGWYDSTESSLSVEDITFMDVPSWPTNFATTTPEYYSSVGVVPKSYSRICLEALPKFSREDYRTKIWQHSCPALGGSALLNPDDQQRQYHPFQLAAFKLDGGHFMDTVNGKNGVWGTLGTGIGGGESVSFISVLELPVHPPFSLAGFAGMRLKPGWYGDDDFEGEKSIGEMRRMQYQAGVPGVGIGNSFADPTIPSDGVYAFHQTNIDSSVPSNGQLFSDFFDHGFIINDALWDRWFCSSISDMPSKEGRVPARETLEAFMSGKEDLPVSRYKKARSSANQEQIIERIMADDGWKHIARYLMVEGGFNVNSVSEEAWTATLLGLAKRELVSNTQGTLHAVEHSPEENVLFSRFAVSTADRSLDVRGDYNILLGAAFLRPSMQMATAWGDVRSLTPESIRELAREIVKKVRERGPFLNMADFINRRLDGGTDAALTGALQAAIDATQINENLKKEDFLVSPLSGDFYKFPRAEEGSMYTAAPGYLIQSDVLASLGNILTVRDDTFTVRAYGCVRNARHAILAQAWCEAVVQRTIEFVDPSNSPEEGSYDPSKQDGRSSRDSNKDLSAINRLMGRKLRVVSFKWLDSWDI